MLNSVTWLIFVILVTFDTSVADDLDHSKCPRFDIKERTIIKVHDSEANGAKFLGRSIVSSSRGCYKKCCEKDNCNLVTLKFEVKRVTCFMFDCGSPSKCLFRTHSTYRNYAAVVLEDRAIQDSLYDSNRSQENDAETSTQEVQTTTAQPPIVSTTKKPWNWYDKVTTVAPHHNFGDSRYDHTESTVARDWLDKVRKISIKDHVTTSSPDDVWQPRNNKKTSDQGYKGSKYTFDRGQDVSSEHKKSHVVTTKAPVEYKATDENDSEEEESFPRRVFVDNNPNFPDSPSQKAPKITNPPTKVSTKKPSSTKKPTTKKKHTTESGYHNVIIKRFNIQENKAVIPLAVGLVLALLLLMAVVFRLKTSRRRRTKAFLTDDADYLINGMYL